MALLILGAVVIGVGVFYLAPSPLPGKAVELVVPPGKSLWHIASTLEQRQVIESARVLVLWMKLSGKERSIQAGQYSFRQHEGVVSAANKLLNPRAFEFEVTIPEGYHIQQIAQVFQNRLKLDSAAFVQAARNRDVAASFGIKASGLEGYLFPDTYRFPPNMTIHQVLERMVKQFELRYAQVVADSMRAGVSLSRHQVVTLASIIEKEAMLKDEQRHIAGVFHNRLKLGYPLGADATVRYSIGKFSGPLRVSELKNPSPYNTRIHRGLPPGPICSPGFGALQAAVTPLKTKDLYFLAKWDGSGAHDFSESYSAHNRKKMQIHTQNQDIQHW